MGLQLEFADGLSIHIDGFFVKVAKILTPVAGVTLLKIFTGMHLKTNAIEVAALQRNA